MCERMCVFVWTICGGKCVYTYTAVYMLRPHRVDNILSLIFMKSLAFFCRTFVICTKSLLRMSVRKSSHHNQIVFDEFILFIDISFNLEYNQIKVIRDFTIYIRHC